MFHVITKVPRGQAPFQVPRSRSRPRSRPRKWGASRGQLTTPFHLPPPFLRSRTTTSESGSNTVPVLHTSICQDHGQNFLRPHDGPLLAAVFWQAGLRNQPCGRCYTPCALMTAGPSLILEARPFGAFPVLVLCIRCLVYCASSDQCFSV